MCYVVYFSTNWAEDLSDQGEGLFIVETIGEDDKEEAHRLLAHPNRWYLASKYGGCSCHYRHCCKENGDWFHPLLDWAPEDPEDVASTGAFYDLICRIVASGAQMDLVDAWNGTKAGDIRKVEVSLKEVPRQDFLFFENARFEFIP